MTPKFQAGMFFSYGPDARAGLKSKNCFDAIKAGERISTTRFLKDGQEQYDNWKNIKIGETVRVFSLPGLKGDWIDIEITHLPRIINLATLNSAQKEDWSEKEGWSVNWLTKTAKKSGYSVGLQILYELKQ